MKILIADDDAAIHRFLHRVITAEFRVDIEHVYDGVQAIEALLKRHYDLLLLDINMPVINGLDTLKAIRRSVRHQGLPVVVMTGNSDEDLVIETLKVGVTDYLTKPLKQLAVHTRVGRLLHSLASTTSPRGGPLQLGPQSRVVIVDGSREFREFFRRCVGPIWVIDEAESGVEALRLCVDRDTRPAAVFVGTDLGLFDETLLVKTLREHADLRSLRVIAVTPSGAFDESTSAGFYDSIIARSFDEDALARALDPLMRWKLHAERLFDPGSPLEQELLRSIDQAFEVGGGLEMRHTAASTAAASDQMGDWIEARLELRNHETGFELRLSCSAASAREMAAAHHRREPMTITVREMLSAIGAIAGLVAARLASGLALAGISLNATEPHVSSSRRGITPARHARDHREWRFQSQSAGTEVLVRIDALGSPTIGAPATAQEPAPPASATG